MKNDHFVSINYTIGLVFNNEHFWFYLLLFTAAKIQKKIIQLHKKIKKILAEKDCFRKHRSTCLPSFPDFDNATPKMDVAKKNILH
jgi:hypothetical protein